MQRSRVFRRAALPLSLAAVISLLGCSDPLGPFNPEITNATDNFQFQATGVTEVTVTRTYNWTNTGTRATVDHSTTTTAGSAKLTIRDADGTVVYDEALVPSLNEPTATGVAGTWKLEMQLTGYSGTINFRVQKL